MFYYKPILFIFLFTSAFLTTVYSQHKPPGYRLQHFTTENGLPQNTVRSIRFDQSGALWLGTQGGLVYYNGYSFKKAFKDMPSQRVGYIMQDLYDSLWVIDNDNHAFKINPITAEPRKIEEAGDNAQLFFWSNYGSKKPHRLIQRIPDEITFPYTIKDRQYNFYYYSEAKQQVMRFDGDETSLAHFTVRPRLVLVNDKLLAVDIQNGIHCYSNTGTETLVTVLTGDVPHHEKKRFLQSSFFSCSATKAFAIYNNNIYQLSIHQDTLFARLAVAGTPTIDGVEDCIYNASTGTYTISSSVSGLYILQPSAFVSKRKTGPPFSGQSWAVNSIFTQVELLNGSVIDNYGVCYPADDQPPFVMREDVGNRSLLKDKKGFIWYQSNKDYQVIKCDGNFRILQRYPFPGSEIVTSAIQTASGKYFFGTREAIYTLENEKIERRVGLESYMHVNGWLENFCDLSDTITLVLAKTGLYLLNQEKLQLRSIDASRGINFRISQKTKAGNLWLGSYGSGLYLFRDGKIIAMPLDLKGNLKNVNAILDDDNGFLWLSTNNGLFQVKEADLIAFSQNSNERPYYHYYDKSYGFNTNEFNGGAANPAIKLQNGVFSFSSIDGIVQFYPSKIVPLLPGAPVVFSNVRVNDTAYNNIGKGIRLSPGFSRLEVFINSSYFGHPNNLQFEYRIAGYDDGWRNIELGSPLIINHLPTGSYRLEVRKKAGFGVNNFTTSTLNIEVLSPFYQTTWFILLACLLAVALFYLLSWLRVRRVNSRRKILQKVIADRTSELKEKNENLEQTIQHNEMLVSIIAHDIKGPMKFLTEVAEGVSNNWANLSDSRKAAYCDQIKISSHSIYAFTSNFLSWLKLRKQASRQLEAVNLRQLCLGIIHFQHEAQTIHNNTLLINKIDAAIFVTTNAQVLLVLLNNIVDNAVKYTPQGSIELSAATVGDDKVEIACTDTGKGMSETEINRLLSAGSEALEHDGKDSFKLGYIFIRELCPVINASISISSKPGTGTMVKILLPAADSTHPG